MLGDIDVDTARRTVEHIAADRGTATAVRFDLADPDSWRPCSMRPPPPMAASMPFLSSVPIWGPFRADTDVVDIDFEVWDRVMTVNLRGYVATMKYAIPHLRPAVAEQLSTCPRPRRFRGRRRAAYATAKAGIGALTRHVASR